MSAAPGAMPPPVLQDIDYRAGAVADPETIFDAVHAETPWRQESVTLFGKTHPMPRLTCWMGDSAYTYSGLRNEPAPWTPAVARLRALVEGLAGTAFNGVLLNLYRDGGDSMGWHADDEASLGARPVIASVSLGAPRRMRFKAKRGSETFDLDLEPGSVLVMRGDSQRDWLHAIPKTRRSVGPRINLTFRKIL